MRRPIQVLYFAGVREAVGLPGEGLDLPEHVRTLSDLAGHLQKLHPSLDGRLSAVRFAINETFAEPDTALSEGDVVALIPPVSGG